MNSSNKDQAKMHTININTWEKYFKNLLSENRPRFEVVADREHQNLSLAVPYITAHEIDTTLRTMKNGKSAGPGGIPMELIKEAPYGMKECIANMYNKILISGDRVPEEMKEAYVIPIHKKGKKDECDNYRAISVIGSTGRLYGKILKNRIEAEVTDLEIQSGFRAGRSCVDNIFTLHQLMEKRTARNRDTHLIFVDLLKAYDSVPQQRLFQILDESTINSKYVEAIRKMYDENSNRIKVGGELSNKFTISKGLRQGCSLSPMLFKIYVARALQHWIRKCGRMGVEIADDTLFTLLFADDQVIIAEDRDDADYMFRKLQEEYEQWGLTINTKKTHYLVVGKTEGDLVINNTTTVKSVKEFEYLGYTITESGSSDLDIRKKTTRGKRLTQALNPLLWNDTLTQNTKLQIYNTLIKSVATYGSEVWELKKTNISKLEVMEMNYLRRSCGVSLLQHVPNTEIKRMAGVDRTITDHIEIKQLEWYGHVRRMNASRWPQKIWNWTPPQRRKRGRPRTTWANGVQRAMEKHHLQEEDWANRQRWKAQINLFGGR